MSWYVPMLPSLQASMPFLTWMLAQVSEVCFLGAVLCFAEADRRQRE